MKSLRIVGLLGCVLAWPGPAFSQQLERFRDVTQRLVLTLGFAFQLRVTLALASLDAHVPVVADTTPNSD